MFHNYKIIKFAKQGDPFEITLGLLTGTSKAK